VATCSVHGMSTDKSDAASIERILYPRSDGKWAWRLEVNGRIIATDGSQGYEDVAKCRRMADRIIGGYYSETEKKIVRPKKS
jgi:hypothetical protein